MKFTIIKVRQFMVFGNNLWIINDMTIFLRTTYYSSVIYEHTPYTTKFTKMKHNI